MNAARKSQKAAPGPAVARPPPSSNAASPQSRDSSDIEDDGDSYYNDIFQAMADQDPAVFGDDEDACTPLEAARYIQMLHQVGPEEFCIRTVNNGSITAKKLLTAFALRPPSLLGGVDDAEYGRLLFLALRREVYKRHKLRHCNTVDDAIALIRSARNIIVLTGAGVSTSLGIPDFRSPKTGLYDRLRAQGVDVDDPQDVFLLENFREDPTLFFSVAKEILPAEAEEVKFSPTHQFIRLLQDHGQLLTNYTQNIDNIEAAAGIHPDKIVQCHGSFKTATCQKCGDQVRGDTIFAEIRAGAIPRCTLCRAQIARDANSSKRKKKRKRPYHKGPPSSAPSNKRRRLAHNDSDDEDDDDDIPEPGVMKPDIVFFGEDMPSALRDRFRDRDAQSADLAIVIGTSLKVAPVNQIVPSLPPRVPQLYISLEPCAVQNFDVDLLGECDVVVAELCRRLGWDLRHEMIPADLKVDVRLEEGYRSRHRFTAVKREAVVASSGVVPAVDKNNINNNNDKDSKQVTGLPTPDVEPERIVA